MKQAGRVISFICIFALSCGASAVPSGNRIDALVFARQTQTGFPPSGICSDEVFIRRVFLDVIGTLPTATEVREY
ncbi:MAG: DUF1549 domain-containing protein, partial [Kiritimatiellales bacterium]|nr:DUF1549 domain-containing protein [Kiritimatiellales bacterium]